MMDFLAKISAVWQKVSLVQRALLIAVVLTFISAGALLTHWARKPDFRLLYQELGPEEASKIIDKISEKGIAYDLRAGGTSIYVPKEQVYQLRLDMAQEGLPSGDQGGYKIFDNSKIGVSPFIQNVNLQRALQDEIAKSIQVIEGVAHARVHIVNSEQTVFTAEGSRKTASVVLQIKPGHKLSPLNVAAITHLLSGSVEGLDAENVTVIDSQGRLLSNSSGNAIATGSGTVQDYKERVEKDLQNKAEEILTTFLGTGRAKVKVHAVIDTNSITTVTETYDPKGVPIKEEEKTSSEPVAGNTAEGQPATPAKTSEITTQYQVGKTVKQEAILPGEVKSLSVAAVVDLSPRDVNGTDTAASTAKIMELADVEKLIENTLGLNLSGRDSLKVVDVKISPPEMPVIEEEVKAGLDFIAIARQASLGIMAVCALLVLRMFKGAKKKAQSETAGVLTQAAPNAGYLPGQTQNSPLIIRQQITSALERDPEKVRQLFNQWIQES
ncbi:MAG: flagellar M-ring protein FliF [Sedimentisphaerales bacterium]|nr:flagellar M-ring protein FliF [Sedimentisphaerales bacterium]